MTGPISKTKENLIRLYKYLERLYAGMEPLSKKDINLLEGAFESRHLSAAIFAPTLRQHYFGADHFGIEILQRRYYLALSLLAQAVSTLNLLLSYVMWKK